MEKLYAQGFLDEKEDRNELMMNILDNEDLEVLEWFKSKGYIPTEIIYSI